MAKRFGIKLLLVLLLVAFGIFYGVDLATRGMERVYGPLPGSEQLIEEAVDDAAQDTESETTAEAERQKNTADHAAKALEKQNLPSPRSPKITEMIGSGLQKIAQGVVDTVVSIFELFI